MKRGFTLIELLAVIVILAIIALIATPIVLSIINDARQSSTLRSAEFYLDAAGYTIADAYLYHDGLSNGEYPITPDGNICTVPLINNTCSSDNTLEVEVNGEKPSGGYITIIDGNISDVSIELNDKTIVKNTKGELVYVLEDPCKLISGNKNTNGSKYECEVKPGVKYNFFVISQETDGTTNLIMERNICEDGTLATAQNTCLVAWYSSVNNNSYGPVTAMDYVYNATKDWINIPNMIMNYTDEGKNYGTIKTINNITKITKKDGTEVTVLTDKEGYTNLKARLPRYNEVTGTGKCTTSFGSCPLYLVNYLKSSSYVTEEGLQNISGIAGYCTLASLADYSNYARYVSCDGIVNIYDVYYVHYDGDYGVRPVINLKL